MRMAGAAQGVPAQVVAEDEDDVRAVGRGQWSGEEKQQQNRAEAHVDSSWRAEA